MFDDSKVIDVEEGALSTNVKVSADAAAGHPTCRINVVYMLEK